MEFKDGKLEMNQEEAAECLAQWLFAMEQKGKGIYGAVDWDGVDGMDKLSWRALSVQILCEIGYLDEREGNLPFGVIVKWLTPTEA